MPDKPGDLLLGVIDFFGILVPGAVLTYLHGDLLLTLLGVSLPAVQGPSPWIPAFVTSYILGHFLLGFSVPLNSLASRRPSGETAAFLADASSLVRLPPGVPSTSGNIFYSAFSYVRLKSAGAVAELERQAAEYKLFRSLTLLFVLDVPLAALAGRATVLRVAASLAAALLSWYRFKWLLDWTYRLAADFYLQLVRDAAGEKAPDQRARGLPSATAPETGGG